MWTPATSHPSNSVTGFAPPTLTLDPPDRGVGCTIWGRDGDIKMWGDEDQRSYLEKKENKRVSGTLFGQRWDLLVFKGLPLSFSDRYTVDISHQHNRRQNGGGFNRLFRLNSKVTCRDDYFPRKINV